jgi:hypothetical protein
MWCVERIPNCTRFESHVDPYLPKVDTDSSIWVRSVRTCQSSGNRQGVDYLTFTSVSHSNAARVNLPFCCRAQPPFASRLWLSENGHFMFDNWPLSVVGGANRSGFCKSNSTFCGPMSVAPRDPRIGWGVMWEFLFHSWAFEFESGYVSLGILLGAGAAEAASAKADNRYKRAMGRPRKCVVVLITPVCAEWLL